MGDASIYDVAAKAKVSISTVSRVINHLDSVAPKTRRRVEEAMRALNYYPSNSARALSLRRTDTIGLVIPDLGGDYYSDLMRGIDQRAKTAGMHLLVSRASGEREELRSLEQMLGSGRVDGLIIAIAESNDNVVQALEARDEPLIVLDRDVQQYRVDGVRVDNRSGSREATDHLIRVHGISQLLFLGGPENNVDTGERAEGFKDALQRNGLPPSAGQLIFANYDYERGFEVGERLARGGVPAKFGIVTANDDLARGVIDALLRGGISVPGSGVSVIGHDDSRLARFTQPSLTSVHFPLFDLGAMAVDMVLDRIAGRRSQPVQVAMRASLVVRQSCGCGADAAATNGAKDA